MTRPIVIGQFIGAPVHAHRFNGVSLAENTYTPGHLVKAHVHDAPLVSSVLRFSVRPGALRILTPAAASESATDVASATTG